MNDNERFSLTDEELSAVFEGGDPHVPQTIVKAVTPWKKAMKMVSVGFGISALVLNYFPLNIISVNVGSVILFFGLRSLRKENRAFSLGYAISILFLLYYFALSVFEAFAVFGELSGTAPLVIINYSSLILRFIEAVAIVAGVGGVKKKVGLEKKNNGWLLVFWYGIICVCAFFNYAGFFAYVLIAAYIILLIRLYKFSSALDDAGFSITPAKIHIGSKAFSVTFSVLLVVSILLANVFFGSYPMKFKERTVESEKSISAAKENLSSLGFPADVLDDLSTKDLLDCKNAKQVIFEKTVSSISNGIVSENGKPVEQTDDIEFTTIAVLVSGDIVDRETYKPNDDGSYERQEWKIITHFRLLPDKKKSRTECIELTPAYLGFDVFKKASDANGRLLFEKNGKSFEGAFYSIGTGFEKNDLVSSLLGNRETGNIFADFSVPKSSENFRGYISYSVVGNIGLNLLNSTVCYYSAFPFAPYPATTAKEYALGKDNNLFTMFKDKLRAYSSISF